MPAPDVRKRFDPISGSFHTKLGSTSLLLIPTWDLMYPRFEENSNLRVIGVDHIHEFIGTKPPDLARQALVWLSEVKSARWQSLADLRSAYPAAATDGTYITFLVGKRTIAITTIILFQIHLVLVTRVSHLENDTHF
jgi:mRNA-degrading endonuclease HigB of HigAB toxin-antitoxin module